MAVNQAVRTTNMACLEAMIDASTLAEVCNMLAEVCSAKADHVRENWQDEILADAWDKQAARMLNAGCDAAERRL